MNEQPGWEIVQPAAASTLPKAPMPDPARAYELKCASGRIAAVFEYDDPNARPGDPPVPTHDSTLVIVCAVDLSTAEQDSLVEYLSRAGQSAVMLAAADAKNEYRFQWLSGAPQLITAGPTVHEAEGHLSARSAWFEARRGVKPRSS
jgi:hypothetical protein